MKRILSVLTLLFASSNASLFAQESSETELELVRQLREKGKRAEVWNDLARTRISDLLKRGDPMLTAALPFELAQLDIADAKAKGIDKRAELFTSAGKHLQDFMAKNQGKPQAAFAAVELARVTSYHAQAILSTAMRAEENAVRHENARPAEVLFIKAGDELKAAIAVLEAASKDPNNAPVKAELDQKLREARLDLAINIFDKARTYIDRSKDAVNEKRAITMKEAKDEFIKLKSDDSTTVGWLANAWLMKIGMERTDPGEVNQYYFRIMDRKNDKTAQPNIQPAVRLVGYFHLQDITPQREDTETIGNFAINDKLKQKKSMKDRLHDVQEKGKAWLEFNVSHHRSFEGQGVRFEVAYAYYTEAQMEEEPKKGNPKAAADHYAKAVEHLDELAKMEGDLAERARALSMQIKFRTLNTKGELRSFEEYMMKAQIDRRAVRDEANKLAEHAKKMETVKGDMAKLELWKSEQKRIEEDRKKALKEVIKSYHRALALADASKAPPTKVDDARYFLSGAYMASGDLLRGVIVSESLARARSGAHAADGASNALRTYAYLVSREKGNVVLQERLRDLAKFVLEPEQQRSWEKHAVTSLALYHVGISYRETEPKKAIAHLAMLDKEKYPDYIYSQAQLVFIAEAARGALREGDATFKKETKWYIDAAKSAIERLPKLNPLAHGPGTNSMYFFAKMEKAKYMYSEAIEELNAREELKAVKLCNDMRKYIMEVHNEFDKLRGDAMSPENKEQLEFTMQIMLKYADLGIAESKFRSDRAERFDEVLLATKTVVDAAIKKAKDIPGTDPIPMRDYRVTGDILGLALRANVQKGDVDKGKAILEVLQRLAGTEGGKPGPVVAVLLRDIAGQIERMQKDKDPKLATTKTNYTAFLDVIAKEYDKKEDPNSLLTLARAYNSLDYPCKAAPLFAKVKAPPDLDKKLDKKKENDADVKIRQAWEEVTGRHWGVQIEYIRVLRACKESDSLDKAEKIVEAMLSHPNARYKMQAMMEKNLILEDTQRYIAAYNAWGGKGGFLTQSALADRKNPDVRQIYFPAYFHFTRVMYKMGAYDPKIKDRQGFIDAAARNLVNLEFAKTKEGWEIAGPLVMKYLQEKDAEQLKKAYDRLKAERLKGASLSDPRLENATNRVAFIMISEPEAQARTAFRRMIASPSSLALFEVALLQDLKEKHEIH